ncbi:MAG TPA: Asp-tRNA(Asn)/Glu-tRNA(Gln) amidotransferase subunit GatC [Puia sp.]|nr:Asp-tRNA(Asn)/Glu-tRNA(Gln) amidotransferase subunit GatC [Puia sp.]
MFIIDFIMQVDDALIDNLSKLACLEFSVDEREGIKKDLERMISFVEKLNELDVTGTEPLLHMGDTVNVLREDVVVNSGGRTAALQNAPCSNATYFKVPKVIRNPSK